MERRTEQGGRRETDYCSQHCFVVKQYEELKAVHKEDKKSSDERLKAAAPLWSVLVLITIVAGSVAYTFQTSASISREIAEKMGAANSSIQSSLYDIKKDLEVAKSRQSDIKVLLEKHIQKYESMSPNAANRRDN